MKNLILILVFIVASYCNNIVAQNVNNYNLFVHIVDSLKTEYSVREFINSVKIPYEYRDFYSALSENDQNKVIDYICELYDQKEYLGLYRLASKLLDEYYSYSKNDVKKRIIEIWYDKRCYSSSSVVDLGSSEYYTQHTKDRILEIVKKRWTQEDIDAWTMQIKQALNVDNYKREVADIMKQTNRKGKEIEKFLLDSLVQDKIEKKIQQNINRPLNKWVIMMIGSLNDQRFIPNLERMIDEYENLEVEDYSQTKEACVYALAKLGEQKYIDEIFANDEDIKWKYLGTKEAFIRWLETGLRWDKMIQMRSDSPSSGLPLAVANFYFIKDIIPYKVVPAEMLIWIMEFENFDTSVIGKDYDPFKDEKNKVVIDKIYKLFDWMKNNQDKWELPPANDSY